MMRRVFALTIAVCLFAGQPAQADSAPVRIGVLTDMSGSMANLSGKGSVEAAQMAVEDFQARQPALRQKIELISADYQNRGDLAQHISEDWITKQGVDVVVDIPNASITSRLQDLFRDHKKLMLTSCSSAAPGNLCSPDDISWLYGLDIMSRNLVQALLKENKMRWFVISSDDAYSQQMATQVISQLRRAGATLAGEAQLARRMAGLDVVLEQIKPADTDVIYLAMDHHDLMRLLHRWPEKKPSVPLALASLQPHDVAHLDDDVPPIYTIAPFYWEQDAPTQNWANAFAKRTMGMPPTVIHASVYSAVTHYLKAINAIGSGDAGALMAYMKKQPLDAMPFGPSVIRPDGLVQHRLLLLETKPPKERQSEWGVFKVVRTLQPTEVLLPPELKCDALPPPP